MLNESILDPQRPIVDAHHHLYARPGMRYLAGDYASDLASGHDIRRTVYVQARHAYDVLGPEALRPVGETRFARTVAEQAVAHGGPAIAAAIVPFADLLMGDAVRPVLEKHLEAGGGRVRGVRQVLAWSTDGRLLNPGYPTSEGMMESGAFQRGFRHLAPLGLSFDAWLLFPQLAMLTRLADAFPDTRIVLDHCGGPVSAAYHGANEEAFSSWLAGMSDAARRPNVFVKLSGLGMPIIGLGFDVKKRRPSSCDLAAAWRPWMDACINLFGPESAMFASNFPADRPSYDYAVGWNAMKLIAAGASEDEKDRMFARTAADFYRLGRDIQDGKAD